MSAKLILPCAGCGKQYDRLDMLEAYIPDRIVRFEGIAEPFDIHPMRLDWVGPCCAELANEWQP